jgi:hypothetical protein
MIYITYHLNHTRSALCVGDVDVKCTIKYMSLMPAPINAEATQFCSQARHSLPTILIDEPLLAYRPRGERQPGMLQVMR